MRPEANAPGVRTHGGVRPRRQQRNIARTAGGVRVVLRAADDPQVEAEEQRPGDSRRGERNNDARSGVDRTRESDRDEREERSEEALAERPRSVPEADEGVRAHDPDRHRGDCDQKAPMLRPISKEEYEPCDADDRDRRPYEIAAVIGEQHAKRIERREDENVLGAVVTAREDL